MLITEPFRPAEVSPGDYRVPVRPRPFKSQLVVLVVWIVLPITSVFYFEPAHLIERWSVRLSLSFASLFVALFICFRLFQQVYHRITGYPPLHTVSRYPNYGRFGLFASLSGTIVLLILVFLSGYSLVDILAFGTLDVFLSANVLSTAQLGLSLSVLTALLQMVAERSLHRNSKQNIFRLERDAVLSELPDQDLRDRIEQDLLEDVSLERWIKLKAKSLTQGGKQLTDLSGKLSAMIGEMLSKSGEENDERIASISSVIDQAVAANKQFHREIMRMLKWLYSAKAQQLFLTDSYFDAVVDDTFKEIKALSEDVGRRVNVATKQAKSDVDTMRRLSNRIAN